MSKQCQACGHPFTSRPQNPNQKYCTNSECQRERRRRWQQQKRRDDADYRDNDVRHQQGLGHRESRILEAVPR